MYKITDFNNWNSEVSELQEWKGELKWDPDSSPEAWEHYKKYYTTEHWRELEKYDLDRPTFFNFINNYGYINKPIKEYNRWYALEKEVQVNANGYYEPCLRLGGETDFNFKKARGKYKKNKYRTFCDIIKKSGLSREKRKDALELLETCNKMHYSPLNFSLIQTVGNLQSFKNEGLIVETEKYENLDRLDTFVYYLSEFYKENQEKRAESSIIKRQRNRKIFGRPMSEENVKSLINYLNSFEDIYDYCNKIYFIKINDEEKGENDFIQKLIKSGEKILETGDDIVEYMKLAGEFWKIKKAYFESVG